MSDAVLSSGGPPIHGSRRSRPPSDRSGYSDPGVDDFEDLHLGGDGSVL
jgi:hypothetical protein